MQSPVLRMSPDPYPPSGSVQIVQGEQTTSVLVDLLIEASDSGHEHGDDDDEVSTPPGTAKADLLMRVSTDQTFDGVEWAPYQRLVSDFDLGPLAPDEFSTVYVQFMDELENISEDVAGDTDATVQFVSSPTIATVRYQYFMQSGDTGLGTLSLLSDGRFLGVGGEQGNWVFQAAPGPRIVFIHDAGNECTGRILGNFTSGAALSGLRWCADGSADFGLWFGAFELGAAHLARGQATLAAPINR